MPEGSRENVGMRNVGKTSVGEYIEREFFKLTQNHVYCHLDRYLFRTFFKSCREVLRGISVVGNLEKTLVFVGRNFERISPI